MQRDVRAAKREKNPREKSNFLSVFLFIFTFKTFRKGARGDLKLQDIYDVMENYRSDRLGDRLEKEWEKEFKKPNPAFLRPIINLFWFEYFVLGIAIFVVETIVFMVQPTLMGKVVGYFERNSTVTQAEALTYAGGLLTVTLLYATLGLTYIFRLNEMSMRIQIGCSSLLYRKCLKLNSARTSQSCAAGTAVTIMSKDLVQFNEGTDYFQLILAGAIQVCIMTYLMYSQIGVAALYGTSLLFALVPIQVYMGKKTGDCRLKTAAKTDQRVRMTQEILTAMRIIKMYTWELFFSKCVNTLRKKELKHLRLLFYIKTFALTIGQLSSRLAFYICVITYVAMGNHITAEKAFVVTGCFSALNVVLVNILPTGIPQLAELKACVKRITDFMNLEEVPQNSTVDHIDDKQPSIHIEKAAVKSEEGVDILENINLEIQKGLTALTGTVGAGKSSLIKLVLGEVKKSNGIVRVAGKKSYASQEPWIFPGTVRQNIIFAEQFDQERYDVVVTVCALKKDFEAFPQGDQTRVTDRGLNMSRGQKARLNLARAVYKIADIYLLDDCLAALDAHVGKHIFNQCIRGFLKDSICVLVTHQNEILRQANKIVLLDNGSVKFEGSYSELEEASHGGESEIPFIFSKREGKVEKSEEKIPNHLVDDANESTQLLLNEDEGRNIYEETNEEGSVNRTIYFKYFTSGGGIKIFLVIILFSVGAQIAASWSDYFVSYWVDMEQDLSAFRHNHTTHSGAYKKLEESYGSVMRDYSLVIVAAAVLALIKAFSFFNFSLKASKNIHTLIFNNILNAGMIFFDRNLSGNILNRFSRDLGIVDEQLLFVINDVTTAILSLFGVLVVVTSVNLFFIIPSTILAVVLYFARRFYIPTGRSVRRLEGATRSPVIGHLNATMEGLTTIRAYQAQTILTKEFDNHQDLYYSVAYMRLALNRAFSFYLNTLGSFYISVITLTFLFIKTDSLAGQVGLAITQSFSVSGILNWGIKQWAELETQMTSVERVLEYNKTEAEDKSGTTLNNWPSHAKIVYQNVDLRYSPGSDRILKNLTFVIEPKQKIGVVGRTGAGKTSIISTLFRMYDYEGSICVDDVDIKNVKVDWLRTRISMIPQDPVLFSGTIRSNLDPNKECDDKDVWEALEEVEMKKLVGDLNSTVSEGGVNFSIGQRQLLCLARAILKKNMILILDEATANVDPQTDALIQKTIRKKFLDCTVITIAHRLHTIMDSHKVLVMDSGVAIEFDNPRVLIDKKGAFYVMAKESGLL